MEALTFLRFWKLKTFYTVNEISYPIIKITGEEEEAVEKEEQGEDEESFFDLELITNQDLDNNRSKNSAIEPKEKQTVSLSSSDPISKRKVLPIEPSSRPQSPIAFLKSAPKFSVIFKKQKSTAAQSQTEKTESMKQQQPKQEANIFTFSPSPENSSECTSSKRFTKEVIMQKYLKRIKPLYEKVSKRYTDKTKFCDDTSISSSQSFGPVASPAKEKGNIPMGIFRHLGKSKSASATAFVAALPQNRSDDSLSQQDDAIQSAILHCKSSFNAARGPTFSISGSSLINSNEDGVMN